jgi:hypothetical protein
VLRRRMFRPAAEARSGDRHRHRAEPEHRRAVRPGTAWPLAAVAVVTLVGLAALHRPVRPGEGLLAAEGFLLLRGGGPAPPALSPDGVGAAEMAVHATLFRAFDRHDTLLAAGRELVLVATIGSAVLLWGTARRLGFGDGATAAVVLLAAAPLLLSSAALLDVPAQLAVPWLLLAAWLVAPGRPTVTARGLALLASAVATLLAPDVLLLALFGTAAAVATGRLMPRAGLRGRLAGAVVFVPVIVLVTLLLPHWDPPREAAAGLGTGTRLVTTVAFLLVGGMAAWRLDRFRVPASALVGTTLTAIAPLGRLSAVIVCLPLAAVLTVALADQAVERSPERTRRMLRVAGAAVLACAVVGAVVLLVRAPPTGPEERTVTAVLDWADQRLPAGGRLVAPLPLWAELVHAGGDEDVVRLPGTAGKGDLLHPVVVAVQGTPPHGALVLARFPGTTPPLRVVDPAPGVPTPAELARRRAIAAALLANPTTVAGARAASLLRSADVDPRLLFVLAGLGAQYGIGIADFPPAPYEPASGVLAHQALVDGLGGAPVRPGTPATERLLAWLHAQVPPFAPDSARVTGDGVLIDFRYVSAPDALVTRLAP